MITNKDERINLTLARLYSFGFWGIFLITAIYIGVMTIFLNAQYKEYSFAVYLLFGMLIYVTLAPILMGIIDTEPKPFKAILISSIVTGLIVGGVSTFNNFVTYRNTYFDQHIYLLIPVFLVTFISGFMLSLLIITLVTFLNNWRQNKIKKALDKEKF